MANGEEKTLLEAESDYTRRYKLSLWWVTHRETLKRIGLGLILAAEGAVLLFVLWTFTDSYLVSYGAERDAVARMVLVGQQDLRAYSVATAARPLDIEGATSFALGEGKYDLYASVQNPNTDWWAEFSYAFVWPDGETEVREGFILPGEERPFIVFSHESATPPRAVELRISDFRWRRVDKRVVNGYETFVRDRLNFVMSDPVIAPATNVPDEGALPARVSFTVRNASAYGYYEPVFYILLMRGPNVVGVNSATLSSLDAGETQEVVVNWFGNMPPATLAQIIPVVNVFDPSVYKPVQGQGGLDARSLSP